LKNTRLFNTGYLSFLLVGGILLFVFQKGDLVIWLNQYSNSTADSFFQLYTDLGLGGMFVFPVLLALFVRYELAISGLFALIFTGVFTFLFKQVLFKGLLRPTAFFTNGELTHFIDGFDYHSVNTFPSGHTMTIFSMMLFITILVNKKWFGAVAFLLALLVGFSRMYLLQHFFIDVYVGSIFGIISCLLGYYLGVIKLGSRYPTLKKSGREHLSFRRTTDSLSD